MHPKDVVKKQSQAQGEQCWVTPGVGQGKAWGRGCSGAQVSDLSPLTEKLR